MNKFLSIFKMFKKEKQPYDPDAPIIYKNPYYKICLACRQITTSIGKGTGFIFKYKGKYFLITAAHVLINKNRISKKKLAIDFDNDDKERFYTASIYYHQYSDVDVCVVSLPENYDTKYFLEYHNEAVIFGSEMFLFGYPGTVDIVDGVAHQDGYTYPVPFIKKGVVAQMSVIKGSSAIILNISSVAGFSGGPIVGFDKRKRPYVIGVHTARSLEYESIYSKDGEELDQEIPISAGFLYAYHISYAIDIIESNLLV